MDLALLRFRDRTELEREAFGRLAGTALAGLWVAGALDALAGPTVAVVGTRAPSDDGRRIAHRLGSDLAAAGVCVLSGLALGIDAAAHEGALAAGAPTIGVLGGGHRRFFPPRNASLARRMIAGGGAVLSPYAPDHPAQPWQFLARNAVVASLADGVVVVEAAERSGALNTASWAADRGIPVMAVPGDISRPKAAGCLALIRDGATLVRDAGDVLAQLGLTAPAVQAEVRREPDDPLGRRLLAALAAGSLGGDELIAAADAPAGAALARLGEFIAAGVVEQGADGRYGRSMR
jgi:DNA processing protein